MVRPVHRDEGLQRHTPPAQSAWGKSRPLEKQMSRRFRRCGRWQPEIPWRVSWQENVLAATQVHLDADNCLEVVIMKARSGEVQHLADAVLAVRGVKNDERLVTPIGKHLK
jgi:hypothetical protein